MPKSAAEITISRLSRFIERIAERVLSEEHTLQAECGWSSDPIPFSKRETLTYRPVVKGDEWGKAWESAWFHLRGEVPAHWSGSAVVARLDFSGEGLVVTPDGKLLQGISNGSVFKWNFNRDLVRLFDSCQGGEEVELWVEAAANALFGIFTKSDPMPQDPERHGTFKATVEEISLCQFDEEHWQLWLDLTLLSGMLKRLPETGVRYSRILRTVDRAINTYAVEKEDANACRQVLQDVLQMPAAGSDLAVQAVGHAHIDTAWLWPVRETIRKCARTFASQLDLIHRYPDYIFGASQPQHYAFVKEHYPELFESIRKAVAAGRWEPQGGMWVEADCNVTGGESLVRQILHGKNFFRDEFGVEVDNLWLPDVFGYSAALPQMLRRSGIDYFVTQKLSWNQTNEFPHHTFKWRGIDGSEVLTHFPPENNYNSMLDAEYLIPARDTFKERDRLDEFLSLFGVGNGGGGPKEENLEWGKRLRDLEGAPRVRFGTARDFFHRLREQADLLESWSGELYLELHRGTLTTQALVKKMNRRLEHRLRALEMLWSCLPLAQYPSQQLDRAWKKLLLNQFHDIIPGSSINEVYRVTHQEHQQLDEVCDRLEEEAAGQLFSPDEQALVLFNSLHEEYRGVITLPAHWGEAGLQNSSGQQLPVQSEESCLTALVTVPPYSFTTIHRSEFVPEQKRDLPEMPELVLENELVRYRFNERGQLLEAYDRELDREILVAGEMGNRLALYDDRPNDWDAWDVDSFYRDCEVDEAHARQVTKLSDGPVRSGIRFELRIGESDIVQDVFLVTGSRRLDFVTRVEWRERHRLLRTSFPTNVKSERASCDIQYGFVERDTHSNTSWEQARFEVAAHRYVDLSDHDYGVALLNDCKYGHRLEGNLLDLALLRAPTNPDPDADRGSHEFTYSLLPHPGDLLHSNVIAEAARLNQGIMLFADCNAAECKFPLQLSGDGLSLEVFKKAEREDCHVVRVVETRGMETSGQLHCGEGTGRETDLMEWADDSELDSRDLDLRLGKFEIRTLKITGLK
jgi:alpha-mannosidase